MDFTWDPAKSADCLLRRGFDFGFASRIFNGPVLERVDGRIPYGERRVIAIGFAGVDLLTVVFTDRTAPGGTLERRIISARRSNQHERKTYQAHLEDR